MNHITEVRCLLTHPPEAVLLRCTDCWSQATHWAPRCVHVKAPLSRKRATLQQLLPRSLRDFASKLMTSCQTHMPGSQTPLCTLLFVLWFEHPVSFLDLILAYVLVIYINDRC